MRKEVISTQSEFVLKGDVCSNVDGNGWFERYDEGKEDGVLWRDASVKVQVGNTNMFLTTTIHGLKVKKNDDGSVIYPLHEEREFVEESFPAIAIDKEQLIQLHAYIGSLIYDER